MHYLFCNSDIAQFQTLMPRSQPSIGQRSPPHFNHGFLKMDRETRIPAQYSYIWGHLGVATESYFCISIANLCIAMTVDLLAPSMYVIDGVFLKDRISLWAGALASIATYFLFDLCNSFLSPMFVCQNMAMML